MDLSTWIALGALAVTLGGLVLRSGIWAGTTAATTKDVARLEAEIHALREWRHKVGDDPTLPVVQLYDMLETRVGRLEETFPWERRKTPRDR